MKLEPPMTSIHSLKINWSLIIWKIAKNIPKLQNIDTANLDGSIDVISKSQSADFNMLLYLEI